MRTAEQWVEHYRNLHNIAPGLSEVREIQADALRHAISIATNEYDKGGTIHDVGAEIQIAVNALEKEKK